MNLQSYLTSIVDKPSISDIICPTFHGFKNILSLKILTRNNEPGALSSKTSKINFGIITNVLTQVLDSTDK